MSDKIRILVVGCGNMGRSHALAYHNMARFEIAGIVTRNSSSPNLKKLTAEIGQYPHFTSFAEALEQARPQAVSINTYPDTHEEYAIKSMQAGAHVFIEKPLAETVKQCENVARTARECGKKLVVGYILHHHPTYSKLVEESKRLGKPLVMRMNLNQQSSTEKWATHKNIMQTVSPIVDCGVHYVDVMCRATESEPIWVNAIGARLSEEIAKDMYNYGQLQIKFADGSIGWYESGWGPQISKEAHFIKDFFGPGGSLSIANKPAGEKVNSDNVDDHVKTNSLHFHSSELTADNKFAHEDEWIELPDNPEHQELCDREQAFFLDAIEKDHDLTRHIENAITTMRIVLAADESIRTGNPVYLKNLQ